MGAGGFPSLAAHFPDRTLVTYHPRNNGERSPADDPSVPITPEVQADDVHSVIEAVGTGVIPPEMADVAVLIIAVWIDPEAATIHQDAIFTNNRVATLAALANGASGRPGAYEVLADQGGVWNPFYQP